MIHGIKSADGEYLIEHDDSLSNMLKMDVIEEQYNAKYIGEFCYKQPTKGWVNQPMALFYTEKKHPEGSNYMGVLIKYTITGEFDCVIIVDGISAVEHEWVGVLDVNCNAVLYSAFRHDYQKLGDLMADGGPDYTRSSMHPNVKFKIVKDKIEVIKVIEK